VTDWHAENSDVLPLASVAVDVMIEPEAVAGSAAENDPTLPTVVTETNPRNTWPWPLPDASQVGVEKNSTRNVLFAALFSVPWTVVFTPSVVADVSTG